MDKYYIIQLLEVSLPLLAEGSSAAHSCDGKMHMMHKNTRNLESMLVISSTSGIHQESIHN